MFVVLLVIAPPSQELEPPTNPERFNTDGRLLVAQLHAADVQDRDGAVPLLKTSRRSFPFIELAFADAAYASERVRKATSITIEIVRNTNRHNF